MSAHGNEISAQEIADGILGETWRAAAEFVQHFSDFMGDIIVFNIFDFQVANRAEQGAVSFGNPDQKGEKLRIVKKSGLLNQVLHLFSQERSNPLIGCSPKSVSKRFDRLAQHQ